MAEIKAFVAHSFLEEDEPLVNSFLRYFDQVKKVRQDFTWDHALSAAPKELADKVLEIIADKNVCIAICTKHQRVLADEKLLPLFMRPNYSKVLTADIGWSASDWIIQEIGLAKGRGMEVIIFLEKGVRQPGGLQGTVEYIEFERCNLERPFGKFLEMVQALTPKLVSEAAVGGETSKEDADKEIPPDDGRDLFDPQADWGEEEFGTAIFRAVARGNDAAQARINAAYLATPFAAEGDNLAVWKSQQELWKIYFGKGGSVELMKRLANEKPQNAKLTSLVASAYADFSDHETAAAKYVEAADKTDNIADKIMQRSSAAIQFAYAGKRAQALAMLELVKPDVAGDAIHERSLFATMRRVYEELKEDGGQLAALEHALELAPDDVEDRFTLAYKHQDVGNEELAFLHYLRIPPAERTAITWNNLGVSYNRLDMRGLSISSYQRAADMGETLAMSNLANCLITAGFLKQAREQVDKALEKENYHENVADSLNKLKQKPAEEDKKKEEALANAKPKLAFLQDAGRALLAQTVDGLAAKWRTQECDLDVTIRNGEFVATGVYDREDSGLAVALGGAKPTYHYTIEIRGRVSGTFIEATIKRANNRPNYSLLSVGDGESKAIMIISPDKHLIRVMENPAVSKPRFYELNAL
jgi:tetratricopeptide (TPR) repeat protein